MPSLRQKAIAALAVTLIAALVGLFLGSLIGREIAVSLTLAHMDQYAARLVADEEASAAELRTALAAVDASEHRACSPAEIGYFRALIFESEFLKDAGRLSNGMIQCSAALGRPAQPQQAGVASFTQQDGTAIYRDLAPYANRGMTTITLQRGDSYVVYTPLTRLHLEPAPMHFTETATDEPTQRRGRLLGDEPGAEAATLLREGLLRQGSNLYATRCSIRYFDCVTAYTTLPEVIRANRERYVGCIGLTGILCALLGLAFAMLYLRNKGMEQQLRRAIRKGSIRVLYQPIVELGSGRIAGAEALARWTDESGAPVPPDVFVRIAEERGYVTELTRVVVRRVLRDFGELLRARTDFRVSVNVTAADLSDAQFPVMLEKALADAGVPAHRLVIEITESSTVRHEQAMQAIRALREKGHCVHIDDFGTGYSSLAYLQDLSVDAIKIDRVFTQAIGTGSVTVGILPQIVAMAQVLHLSVIVEGVETVEQADYFKTAELEIFAQGWLYGKPLPAGEVAKMVSDLDRKRLPERDVAASAANAA
jgi:sensor c-di-GMP phosphodiesterase-like protein